MTTPIDIPKKNEVRRSLFSNVARRDIMDTGKLSASLRRLRVNPYQGQENQNAQSMPNMVDDGSIGPEELEVLRERRKAAAAFSSYCQQDCPFKIIRHELFGKQIVATRAIEANSLILAETPVLTYPSWRGFDWKCMACGFDFNRFDPRLCTICSWPICSPVCELDPMHKDMECAVFATQKIRFPPSARLRNWFFEKFEEPLDGESLVLTFCLELLRGLRLKVTQPQAYNELMAQYYNDRKEDHPEYIKLFNISMDLLRELVHVKDMMGGQDIDQYELFQLAKVIKGNNFGRINPVTKERDGLEGTYVKSARFNHSCSPNCAMIISPNQLIKFRALTAIKENDPLTFNYFSGKLVNSCLWRRQQEIKKGWDFICRCDRCTDPTDLGSHSESVTCVICRPFGQLRLTEGFTEEESEKNLGYLLAMDPLDFTEDALWKCNHCDTIKQFGPIRKLVRDLKKELCDVDHLMMDRQGKVDSYEQFLLKHSTRTLHPNHKILMSAVNRIIKEMISGNLTSRDDFLKLLNHWRYILSVETIYAPGVSDVRARTSGIMSKLILSAILGYSQVFKVEERMELLTEGANLAKLAVDHAELMDLSCTTISAKKGVLEQLMKLKKEIDGKTEMNTEL